jgi:hypothetical protein
MRNDPKVRALRLKHGFEGYAIWNMMLETLTDADGFVIEWGAFPIELYAGDFGLEAARLVEIVDYMVKVQLLQIEGDKLQCARLSERLQAAVDKREQLKEKYQSRVSAAETQTTGGISAAETTQKRREEKRREESIKKEKKGGIDFQSETSEMPSKEAPPVAPPPPAGEDGDLDPEQVVRRWCRADNFAWLTSAKDASGYDPDKAGVTVNDKVSLFCGHHADNEAFQSEPVAFFRRHFKGYLVNAKGRTAANKPAAKPRNASQPAPASTAANTPYTIEAVVAIFRSRYGATLANSLGQTQQIRLAEAKNEAELSAWMEGMYNSLKGGKHETRSGPVALGAMLPNTA